MWSPNLWRSSHPIRKGKKRLATIGANAFASDLILTACMPESPFNTHRNPALQKAVLDSTPSTKPTTPITASPSLEITQTTTLILSSQFSSIPGFISTAQPGNEHPLSGTISEIDIPIRAYSFFRCRRTSLLGIIRHRK